MQFDKILVAGSWRPSETGETLPVISPSDGREFTRIARGAPGDIDAAVRAARRAFEGSWGRMPALERGRLLHKLGELVLAHGDYPEFCALAW